MKASGSVTEIVPYSTEYLTGCHTVAEAAEMRARDETERSGEDGA